jgi:hypothetical protein
LISDVLAERRRWVAAVLVTVVTLVGAAPASAQSAADLVTQAVPEGSYRVQLWTPCSSSDCGFLYILNTPAAPRARIYDSFNITDLGELSPASIVSDVTARYATALKNGDLAVEPITNRTGKVLGYLVRNGDVGTSIRIGKDDNQTLYVRSRRPRGTGAPARRRRLRGVR